MRPLRRRIFPEWRKTKTAATPQTTIEIAPVAAKNIKTMSITVPIPTLADQISSILFVNFSAVPGTVDNN